MPVSPETNLDPGIGAPPAPRKGPLPARPTKPASGRPTLETPSTPLPPDPEAPRVPGRSEALGTKAVGAVVTGPTSLGRNLADRLTGNRPPSSPPVLEKTAVADNGDRVAQSGPPLTPEVPTEKPVPTAASSLRDSSNDEDEEPLTLGARIGQGLGLIVTVLLIYLAATAWQVWDESRVDQAVGESAETADAIVVLGAAQYDGDPSPVLEGRLQKALDLYEAGAAPVLVTTGANQEGDRFTEGFAGYDWLRDRGVPEDAILIDVTGTNTYEQVTSTSAILADAGLETAILVSDPYHNYRLGEIADEVGLEAYVSPTDLESSISNLARETAAVSAGRLMGFRRLSNLRD